MCLQGELERRSLKLGFVVEGTYMFATKMLTKYSFSYIREKFRKNVFYLCDYETHFRFSLLNNNLLRNFILVQPYSDRQGIEGEQLNYIQRKTMQIRQKIKIKNLHQLEKILQGLRINHSEENNVVKILYIFNNKKVL